MGFYFESGEVWLIEIILDNSNVVFERLADSGIVRPFALNKTQSFDFVEFFYYVVFVILHTL